MAATRIIQMLALVCIVLAWHSRAAANARSDSASPIVHGHQSTAVLISDSAVEGKDRHATFHAVSHLQGATSNRAFLLSAGHLESSKSTLRRSTLTSFARQEDNDGGQALDGDSCTTNDDCRTPRRCLDTSSRLDNMAKLCSSSSTPCFCANHRICVSAKDCDDGEECVLDVGYPTCVSVREIERLGLSPVASPSEDAPPPEFGFTGELCSTDAGCEGSRKCRPQRQLVSEKRSCGPEFVTCSCVPEMFVQCENAIDKDEEEDGEEGQEESSEECPDGELCQTVGGNAICYTAKVRAKDIREAMEMDPRQPGVFVDNGAEEDVVCIATHMLGHLKEDELLFSTPRIARVLCDSKESCATAGHMVSYKEKVMMMKTYCELRGCTSKLMYVNSPRFRRAMRIESNTESLSFTALAARYETRSEERLLSLGVRVGLL